MSDASTDEVLGLKATIIGLIFALTVLGGFGVATALSSDDDSHDTDTELHSEPDADEGHEEDTDAGHDEDSAE